MIPRAPHLLLLAAIGLLASPDAMAATGATGAAAVNEATDSNKDAVRRRPAKRKRRVVARRTPPRRRTVRRTVVVHRRRPARTRTVVVHRPSPPPVVVVHEPAPERVVVERTRTVVVDRSRTAASDGGGAEAEDTSYWSDRQLLGVGLRMNGVALQGQKIHLSTLENPVMWGPGLTFSGRVAPRWDLELGADFLSGRSEDFSQRTVPVTLSGLFLLLPDSIITPYGVIGAGVHFTQLSYGNGRFVHDITEVGGHLGAGIKLRLGKDFALGADVRGNVLYKDLGATTSVAQQCLDAGACGRINAVGPEDKFDTGMTFQAGAIFYF